MGKSRDEKISAWNLKRIKEVNPELASKVVSFLSEYKSRVKKERKS